MDVLNQFRLFLTRPHVRPLALSAPILVLLICLPLLRPLRHPDPRQISDDELARLATVQSLVEHRTLAIDHSTFAPSRGVIQKDRHVYSDQPPTLALILAGPYWVMRRFGLTFARNANLVAYLLTVIGAAIPVAAVAGLVYRLGRMFELARPKRAMLAAAVALGSGLISYGVVLNGYAAAAAFMLAACAWINHVAIAKKPGPTSGWLAIAGMCAALAAVIEPAAAIFLVLLGGAVLAMRWRWYKRLGGLVMYALGAAPPIMLHAMLVLPINGDVVPPQIHRDLAIAATKAPALTADARTDDIDDTAPRTGWWDVLGRNLARISLAFFGEHGIFSHFPVVLFGILGVAAVMHRHWPTTTKALATATLIGAAAVVLLVCVVTIAGPGQMFGPQAFMLFLPLVMLWCGAWVRRPHHAGTWAIAWSLLAMSIGVALVGATNPAPRDGYDGYSFAQALSNLKHPQAPQSTVVAARR